MKRIDTIIDDLTESQLATIIEACGYAIRQSTVLSAALSECRFQIPELQDEDGNFDEEFENLVDDFDLANLAILCASRISEMAVMSP